MANSFHFIFVRKRIYVRAEWLYMEKINKLTIRSLRLLFIEDSGQWIVYTKMSMYLTNSFKLEI